MRIVLRELWYDTVAGTWAGGDDHNCPAELSEPQLRSYLEQRYGVEPIDFAWSEVPELGSTRVGWTFPCPSDVVSDDERDRWELVAIPMAATDDGALRPLYPTLARQRAEFERAYAAGELADLQMTTEPERPWDGPVPRLAAD